MADVPQNIDHFNRVVLGLLSLLYESFPRPRDIDGSAAIDIGFDAVPDDATDKEAWNIGTMVEEVIPWLKEEGFLRYEPDPNHREGMYWKVRLTLKGLTILGYVPSSLQQTGLEESLFQKAKKAITSATSTAGKEAMKHVVAEIFKLALAHGTVIARSITL